MTDSLRGIIGLEEFDADAAGYRMRRYEWSSPTRWDSQRGCYVGRSEPYVEIRIGEEVLYDGPSIDAWPQKILEHARGSGAWDRQVQARCAESPLFAARYAVGEAERRLTVFLNSSLTEHLPHDQRSTADLAAREMLSTPDHPRLAALRSREEGFRAAIVAAREHLAAVEASLTVGGLLRAAAER